jgi:hypothetical protein
MAARPTVTCGKQGVAATTMSAIGRRSILGSPVIVFAILILDAAISVQSQTVKFDISHPPRFEDFPVSNEWNGISAPVKLTTRWERMYRTRLMKAGTEPPNFAGHFRVTIWGCGSECMAGAIIDLRDGRVLSLPVATDSAPFSVCQSAFENSGVDYRLDSRLIIVRCGLNYSERLQRNIPDTYYFVWLENRFQRVLFVPGKARR